MNRWLEHVLHVLGVLLIVTVGTLLIVELVPGDPALAILGESATEEQIRVVHERLGLDDPLHVRYVGWLEGVLTGDLGTSLQTSGPVLDAILQRLPVTLEIGGLAILLALMISVPVAALAAYRRGGAFDRAISFGASAGISSPSFVTALVLVFLFGVTFQVFPVTGWSRFTEGVGQNLHHAFLPALTLAISESAVFTRILRSDMISTLQQDFMLAARSKGLSTRYLLMRHALRPSSLSLITVSGLSLGRVMGGAVIVEYVFALPGLGQLTINSILSKDLAMLQGIVLFVAILYVIVNVLVDLSYSVLDPRIRTRKVTA